MSNKTSFKRVALAVVAALGFGVLSSGPSQADVTLLSIATTNGTPTTLNSDSSTAATIAVSYTTLGTSDSISVAVAQRTVRPTGSDIRGAGLYWWDSSTVTGASGGSFDTRTAATASLGAAAPNTVLARYVRTESAATLSTASYGDGIRHVAASTANLRHTATFKFDLGETTVSTLVVGTYGFTAIVTYFGPGQARTVATADFDVVVSRSAAQTLAASTTVDATKTVALMAKTQTSAPISVVEIDSAISAVATASTTEHAYIHVRTFNVSGFAAPESVTAVVTGPGVVCNTSTSPATCGKSLSLTGANGAETLTVRADGTAGVAKIDIKTTSKTFATKSVIFWATTPATYAPKLLKPVISVGSNSGVVEIDARDADKNVWGSQIYLYSSDTTVASTTSSSCSFSADDAVHTCSVTGVKAGETKWTIGNAATLALSTVKSAEFAGPRVSVGTPATVKVEFDKAAYAPGEKALIYVTPLDADGKAIAGGSAVANLLATGGLTSSVAFSSGGDTATTLAQTTLVVSAVTSAVTGAKAGSAMYTVYMPFGKGTVTLTAKGGTALPAAGQVALTASASVVDDSVDAAVDAAQEATDAAIAATDAAILAQEAADEAASAAVAAQETAQAAVDAVTALSGEVTKLVAQLATLQKLLNRVAKRVGVKL
jgi:hypothetical protein